MVESVSLPGLEIKIAIRLQPRGAVYFQRGNLEIGMDIGLRADIPYSPLEPRSSLSPRPRYETCGYDLWQILFAE